MGRPTDPPETHSGLATYWSSRGHTYETKGLKLCVVAKPRLRYHDICECLCWMCTNGKRPSLRVRPALDSAHGSLVSPALGLCRPDQRTHLLDHSGRPFKVAWGHSCYSANDYGNGFHTVTSQTTVQNLTARSFSVSWLPTSSTS